MNFLNKPRQSTPSDTYVIAEIGSNHQNDLVLGKQLIQEAANAGCNAVKFQLFKSEKLYDTNTPNFANYKNVTKLMKDLELSTEHATEYALLCDELRIDFLITPFDEDSLDFIHKLGVNKIKIAGFEASDPRFVKMCADVGQPLIISIGNGMSLADAIDLEDKLLWDWNFESDITFLHCNSAYPTPYHDACLGTITQYKNNLSHASVGYSDHTEEIITPAFAVMLGATVIEKHITLDKKLKGPDHKFALEPLELREMVRLICEAEVALMVKPPGGTRSEQEFSNARRAVFAKRDIPAGTILTEELLTTKRPWLRNTVPASMYYDIIGAKLKTDYKAGDMLIEGDLQDVERKED